MWIPLMKRGEGAAPAACKVCLHVVRSDAMMVWLNGRLLMALPNIKIGRPPIC